MLALVASALASGRRADLPAAYAMPPANGHAASLASCEIDSLRPEAFSRSHDPAREGTRLQRHLAWQKAKALDEQADRLQRTFETAQKAGRGKADVARLRQDYYAVRLASLDAEFQAIEINNRTARGKPLDAGKVLARRDQLERDNSLATLAQSELPPAEPRKPEGPGRTATRAPVRRFPSPSMSLVERAEMVEAYQAHYKAMFETRADVDKTVHGINTALTWAAGQGDVAAIEAALAAGADPNLSGRDGRLPVHVAVLADKPAVIEALAASGRLQPDHPGFAAPWEPLPGSALGMAVRMRRTACVRALLEKANARTDLMSDAHTLPFTLAAATGETAMTEAFIAVGADPNIRDLQGVTPLHMAAQYNKPDVISLLAASPGVALDLTRPSDGKTAIHIALSEGHAAAVGRLAILGADPNLPDHQGQPPIHTARELNKPELVRSLAVSSRLAVDAPRTRDGKTALHLATDDIREPMVSALLAAGANPEQTVGDGSRLFHRACSLDSGMARAYLDAGADPNTPDSNGNTALEMALHSARQDLLAVLVASDRITLDVPGPRGGPAPLHLAMQQGNVRSVQILLGAGADPGKPDSMGRTPLTKVVSYGTTGLTLAKVLVAAGADPNQPNSDGSTPFSEAARFRPEAIPVLAASGKLVVDAPDARHGVTQLHLAVRRDNAASAQALLDAGANWGLRDQEGKTPIDTAIALNHTRSAEVLARAGAAPTPWFHSQRLLREQSGYLTAAGVAIIGLGAGIGVCAFARWVQREGEQARARAVAQVLVLEMGADAERINARPLVPSEVTQVLEVLSRDGVPGADDIETALSCPVTTLVYSGRPDDGANPLYVTRSGHTFSRDIVERTQRYGNGLNPMTGAPLGEVVGNERIEAVIGAMQACYEAPLDWGGGDAQEALRDGLRVAREQQHRLSASSGGGAVARDYALEHFICAATAALPAAPAIGASRAPETRLPGAGAG